MGWHDDDRSNDSDPWTGNKKQSTPPDIDKVMRDVKRKLSGVLGSGSGGSTTSNDGSNLFIGFIFIVLFLVWTLSGIYIVRPAEKAVILRFGKYIETVGPGPHWLPRFIDNKYIVNVGKVYNYAYNALMLTKDENIVSVAVAVQYRVNEPNNYLFNVINPQESLQQATASALRQVVGHTTLDDVLTTGRETVRVEVTSLLEKILKRYSVGIAITDVALLPAKAPEEVKDAFDDAINAQEDEHRYVNQAQAYARRIVPIAEGDGKKLVKEAGAYKEKMRLKAEGEVARFLRILPEYKSAPGVTRERLYLDAIEQVLQHTSKVIVSASGNSLFYLPLDKILPYRASALPKVQPQPTTVPLRAAPANTLSSRDISRRLTREAYQGRGGR